MDGIKFTMTTQKLIRNISFVIKDLFDVMQSFIHCLKLVPGNPFADELDHDPKEDGTATRETQKHQMNSFSLSHSHSPSPELRISVM